MRAFPTAAHAAAAHAFQAQAQQARIEQYRGTRAAVGACPPIVIMPGHVEAEQGIVRQQRDQLRAALGACVLAGRLKATDPIWGQWSPMAKRVDDFLAFEPHWYSFDLAAKCDEGEAIERDLHPWFERVKSLCPGGPLVTPPTPTSGSLSELLANISPWVLALLVLVYMHNQPK